MAGPGAKGGMWSKGSNGKRVLITKKMARQMASSGMSAQTDEEYADQASKLREQNNAEAKAKRKADVETRTIKDTRYSVPRTSALVPISQPSTPKSSSGKKGKSEDEWVNPNPIKNKDLKAEIKKYFADDPYFNYEKLKINKMSDLRQLEGYRILERDIEARTGEKFSLSNRNHLEQMYRRNIGILPGEDKETGPKTVNGINVIKYWRPYHAFGIKSNASDSEKKAAYRKWSKKYHPDNQETGDREMFERGHQMYKSMTADISMGNKSKKKSSKRKKKS